MVVLRMLEMDLGTDEADPIDPEAVAVAEKEHFDMVDLVPKEVQSHHRRLYRHDRPLHLYLCRRHLHLDLYRRRLHLFLYRRRLLLYLYRHHLYLYL